MKFDKYTVIARFFPTMLALPPFFVLYFYFLSPHIYEFIHQLLGLQIVSGFTFSIAAFFLVSQLSRFLGKRLFEEKIFDSSLHFPTTNFLLHSDSEFTESLKREIHSKINQDFTIRIPNKKSEINDEVTSRKIITEAVSRIRFSVGNGRLLLQHNAEYGFWRNFSGAAVLSLLVSAIGSVIFFSQNVDIPFWISFSLLLAYALQLLFSKQLIMFAAKSYARILFQEYIDKTI